MTDAHKGGSSTLSHHCEQCSVRHRAMCAAAGHKGPLHECSMYGSKEAGRKLAAMLALGASKPWPEALEVLTGSASVDAGDLLAYFAPLSAWLEEQNRGKYCGF